MFRVCVGLAPISTSDSPLLPWWIEDEASLIRAVVALFLIFCFFVIGGLVRNLSWLDPARHLLGDSPFSFRPTEEATQTNMYRNDPRANHG